MNEQGSPEGKTHFLSYSRSDERFALRLARDLRAQGVAMWVDQLDIRPSEHWDRAIERAVRACSGLVVILSPRSAASENVADEISFAIDSGKSVLPVMIEKCVLPLRITRMHLIDGTGSYDKVLQQCLAELTQTASPANTLQPRPSKTEPLDPEILATAKQRLAVVLGPIAEVLVDKAAQRAVSPSDLYGALALHIDDETDRQRFLAAVRPPQGQHPTGLLDGERVQDAAIEASDVEALGRALTAYLGPIAPLVIKREGRASNSLEELHQRLAALIPSEQDRGAFLRLVKSP